MLEGSGSFRAGKSHSENVIRVVIYWPKEEQVVEDSGLLSILEYVLPLLLPLHMLFPLQGNGIL